MPPFFYYKHCLRSSPPLALHPLRPLSLAAFTSRSRRRGGLLVLYVDQLSNLFHFLLQRQQFLHAAQHQLAAADGELEVVDLDLLPVRVSGAARGAVARLDDEVGH